MTTTNRNVAEPCLQPTRAELVAADELANYQFHYRKAATDATRINDRAAAMTDAAADAALADFRDACGRADDAHAADSRKAPALLHLGYHTRPEWHAAAIRAGRVPPIDVAEHAAEEADYRSEGYQGDASRR